MKYIACVCHVCGLEHEAPVWFESTLSRQMPDGRLLPVVGCCDENGAPTHAPQEIRGAYARCMSAATMRADAAPSAAQLPARFLRWVVAQGHGKAPRGGRPRFGTRTRR